jgi:nicotinate-nucleotide adenylyltransferase
LNHKDTKGTKNPETPAVALFGGSFNPPHLAHALVAAWALATGEAGECWVIPSGGHPFGKPLAPFEDRLAMCRLAFGFCEKIRVLDVEREPRVHYTIDTIRRLAAEHPGRRWRWLLGSDALADAPKWKDYEEILRLAPPLVIPRQGRGERQEPSDGLSLPDVSSTRARELLASGGDAAALRGLLAGPVLDYVLAKRLYGVPGSFSEPTPSGPRDAGA